MVKFGGLPSHLGITIPDEIYVGFRKHYAEVIAPIAGMAQDLGRYSQGFITADLQRSLTSAINLGAGANALIRDTMQPMLSAQSALLADTVTHSFRDSVFDSIGFKNQAWPGLEGITALSGQLDAILDPIRRSITDLGTGIDWTRLKQSFDKLMPPNWPEDVDFAVALVVINDEGIPLVWVPRPELVALLLKSSDETARLSVIEANAATIVGDVTDCLDIAERVPALTGHVELTRKAIRAFVGGHPEAAQSLATNVLDSLVLSYVGRHKDAQKLPPVDDDILLAEFVQAASLSPLSRAFQPFWADRGDPIPTSYNRHATVHGGSTIQFSVANCIVAFMLVASFLRSISEQQDPHAA